MWVSAMSVTAHRQAATQVQREGVFFFFLGRSFGKSLRKETSSTTLGYLISTVTGLNVDDAPRGNTNQFS